MRERDRKSIEIDKMLPQFTTMNVIEGQAGLVNYSSLIFYSLTLNNIINIIGEEAFTIQTALFIFANKSLLDFGIPVILSIVFSSKNMGD